MYIQAAEYNKKKKEKDIKRVVLKQNKAITTQVIPSSDSFFFHEWAIIRPIIRTEWAHNVGRSQRNQIASDTDRIGQINRHRVLQLWREAHVALKQTEVKIMSNAMRPTFCFVRHKSQLESAPEKE